MKTRRPGRYITYKRGADTHAKYAGYPEYPMRSPTLYRHGKTSIPYGSCQLHWLTTYIVQYIPHYSLHSTAVSGSSRACCRRRFLSYIPADRCIHDSAMANPNTLHRDNATYMVRDSPDMGSGMSERLFQLAFPEIYAKADSYRDDI